MAPATDHEVNFALGFILATIAGFATVLGVAFIPLTKVIERNTVTAGALAFASGVMIWIAFTEALGAESSEHFEHHFEHAGGHDVHDHDHDHRRLLSVAWTGSAAGRRLHVAEATRVQVHAQVMRALWFFIGAALTLIIDYISEMVTKDRGVDEGVPDADDDSRFSHGHGNLAKVSVLAFVALTLHNLPEGLATFFSGSLHSYAIVFAIAMHNIPEGAAIAIPVYQSCKQRWMPPLVATTIAGAAQPIGALVGLLLVSVTNYDDAPDFIYGAMFAATAGIMIAISVIGLIPQALEMWSPMPVSLCIFAGFFIMECTIILIAWVSVLNGDGDVELGNHSLNQGFSGS